MAEELEESELGTQEYWDKMYKTEVSNFRNHGDVGEVWFGEDISDRIIQWMEKNVPKTSTILDIGCGNGMLLVELATSAGYENLTGTDYSEDAIVLAKEVAARYEVNIKFMLGDILKSVDLKDYDVVLDKGTYDAISLTTDAKNNRQTYITNVFGMLKDNGLLIITSCNWTKDELTEQFESAFVVADVIPTPQFQFGGKVGNIVSSVVFKKK